MTTVRSPAARTRRPDGDHETLHHPLVSEQYFDRLSAGAADMPEKRLMLAVLFDAVLHLHRSRSTEVMRWILSESAGPFSFNGICETFGIEPCYLARRLLSCAEYGTVPNGPLRMRRAQRGNTRIAPPRLRRRRPRATSSAAGDDPLRAPGR